MVTSDVGGNLPPAYKELDKLKGPGGLLEPLRTSSPDKKAQELVKKHFQVIYRKTKNPNETFSIEQKPTSYIQRAVRWVLQHLTPFHAKHVISSPEEAVAKKFLEGFVEKRGLTDENAQILKYLILKTSLPIGTTETRLSSTETQTERLKPSAEPEEAQPGKSEADLSSAGVRPASVGQVPVPSTAGQPSIGAPVPLQSSKTVIGLPSTGVPLPLAGQVSVPPGKSTAGQPSTGGQVPLQPSKTVIGLPSTGVPPAVAGQVLTQPGKSVGGVPSTGVPPAVAGQVRTQSGKSVVGVPSTGALSAVAGQIPAPVQQSKPGVGLSSIEAQATAFRRSGRKPAAKGLALPPRSKNLPDRVDLEALTEGEKKERVKEICQMTGFDSTRETKVAEISLGFLEEMAVAEAAWNTPIENMQAGRNPFDDSQVSRKVIEFEMKNPEKRAKFLFEQLESEFFPSDEAAELVREMLGKYQKWDDRTIVAFCNLVHHAPEEEAAVIEQYIILLKKEWGEDLSKIDDKKLRAMAKEYLYLTVTQDQRAMIEKEKLVTSWK